MAPKITMACGLCRQFLRAHPTLRVPNVTDTRPDGRHITQRGRMLHGAALRHLGSAEETRVAAPIKP